MPDLRIIAPALLAEPWSQAEALGSIVWLWMYAKEHREMPLHTLPTLLLPALRHGQFILGIEADKPVFYIAWAEFDAAAEARYLQQHPLLMPIADWQCGDRTWILDWVAPFGHTAFFQRKLRRQWFANRCARALYHRGDEHGLRVLEFSGAALLPAEAKDWFDRHPLDVPLPPHHNRRICS